MLIKRNLTLLAALIATTGCGAVDGLFGNSSGTTPSPHANADAAPSPEACRARLAKITNGFEAELNELDRRPTGTPDAVKQVNRDLQALRKKTDPEIRKLDCETKDQVARGVLDRVGKHEAKLARRALDAGDPLLARTLLGAEYDREDRVEKPELRQLSRDIGAAYDAKLLGSFEQNGALGDNGKPMKMCLFSDKPFPKDPGVKNVFSTHVEGPRLHVMCRLPQPAATFQTNVDPELVIMLGIDSGNSIFPVKSVSLGAPSALGQAQLLHAEFAMPPGRKDFDGVVRHTFDVYLQLFYEVNVGGVLQGRKRHLAASSVYWHR
jgi:hypothetical protein